MIDQKAIEGQFAALGSRALGVGVVVAVLSVIGFAVAPTEFLRAYLVAYLFWLGIALGSLGALMLHHITGGRWGFAIRRMLEAAAMTLPLLALLFLPILLGMRTIYAWTDPSVIASDAALMHKSRFFLDSTWFIVRAAIYFAVWIGTAVLLRRWSLEQDKTGDVAFTRKFQHFCGPGLVLYVCTMSLAAIDWIMTLEPTWYSSIFGLILITGQGLSAFAFSIVILAWIARRNHLEQTITDGTLRDLGNLMQAFVVLCLYMSFSQYLIIWSGNIAKEAAWYVHRSFGGWQWVSLAVVLLKFAVPFVLLLFGNLKRSFRALPMIAVLLLFAQWLDLVWIVIPAFHPEVFTLDWLDITVPIAIGGVWMAVFTRYARGAALVPLHDPRLAGRFEAVEAPSHG